MVSTPILEGKKMDTLTASLDEIVRHRQGEHELLPIATSAAAEVKQLRKDLGLTQDQFAEAYRLSIDTVRGWEQGRRAPDGPAQTLLSLILHDPKAIKDQLEGLGEKVRREKRKVAI